MLTRKALGALNILGDKYGLTKANLTEQRGFLGEIFSYPGFGHIDIDENLAGESLEYRETLLHETFHALSNILNLNLSEEQVSYLAGGLALTISDNPKHFNMSAFPDVTPIVKLWKEGFSLREVGVKMGCGKDKVRTTLNSLGYITKHPYVETVERQSVLTGEVERQTDETDGKTPKKRHNVGGKLVFMTLLLIFTLYLTYHLMSYLKNRRARQTEPEKETTPKTDANLFDPTRDIESDEFLR